MIWIALLALLLEVCGLSAFTPHCPDTGGKSYHENLLPDVDFYVCVDGMLTEFITCSKRTYISQTKCESDDPCCEKYFSTKNIKTTPKPIGRKNDIDTAYKPIFTRENILRYAEAIIKEAATSTDSVVSTMVMPTTDEPEVAKSENIEITVQGPTESKSVFSESNTDQKNLIKRMSQTEYVLKAEPTISLTTELNPNIDATESANMKSTNEKQYTPIPVNASSEKLKEFTEKVIIPVIHDIVNNHSKMSIVAGLFRKYFQAVVPLATEILEQLEDHPGCSIKLPREKVIDTVKKIKNTADLWKNAFLEILPSILYKLGDNIELFTDTMSETGQRFQINFVGLPFKYLFLYLEYSNIINETSTDEFITFQRAPEVRKDVEAMSKIMTEITENPMFLEELNPTAIMLQLIFF